MEELISLLLVDMAHAQLRTDSNSLESVTNAGTAKPLMQRLVQSVEAGRTNLLACAVCRGGYNAPHLLRWKPYWYAVLDSFQISRGNNSRRSRFESVSYDVDNILLVSRRRHDNNTDISQWRSLQRVLLKAFIFNASRL